MIISKTYQTKIVAVLISIFLFSCMNFTSETVKWMDAESVEDVPGKYHILENDGIKVYLPEVFKRYSLVEYGMLLDSLTAKKDYEYEIKRLKSMAKMDGSMYIFFDEDSGSNYTINTMSYMPLLKKDAQYLLGMVRLNHEKITKETGYEFKKITAKYTSSSNAQIFRCLYKITHHENKHTTYSTSYIVSSNKHTVFINLSTPFQVSFDSYLEKMIM